MVFIIHFDIKYKSLYTSLIILFLKQICLRFHLHVEKFYMVLTIATKNTFVDFFLNSKTTFIMYLSVWFIFFFVGCIYHFRMC